MHSTTRQTTETWNSARWLKLWSEMFYTAGRALRRSLAWLACSTGENATTYTTVVGDRMKEHIRPTGKHWLCSQNRPVPHLQTQDHWDHSKETLREAQTFCGKARRRKRVPMRNQSTTSNTHRHIQQRQCTAQRIQTLRTKNTLSWFTPDTTLTSLLRHPPLHTVSG